eukprot:SAG31_NODE_1531_length_7992_cov_2.794121_1_plen_205_part_00
MCATVPPPLAALHSRRRSVAVLAGRYRAPRGARRSPAAASAPGSSPVPSSRIETRGSTDFQEFQRTTHRLGREVAGQVHRPLRLLRFMTLSTGMAAWRGEPIHLVLELRLQQIVKLSRRGHGHRRQGVDVRLHERMLALLLVERGDPGARCCFRHRRRARRMAAAVATATRRQQHRGSGAAAPRHMRRAAAPWRWQQLLRSRPP